MNNTSAQDDFAKWAKLRRQHDKKKDEYDRNGMQDKSLFSEYGLVADLVTQRNPSNPSAQTSTAAPALYGG